MASNNINESFDAIWEAMMHEALIVEVEVEENEGEREDFSDLEEDPNDAGYISDCWESMRDPYLGREIYERYYEDEESEAEEEMLEAEDQHVEWRWRNSSTFLWTVLNIFLRMIGG